MENFSAGFKIVHFVRYEGNSGGNIGEEAMSLPNTLWCVWSAWFTAPGR